MRVDEPLLRLPLQFEAATLAAEIAALPADAWRPHPNRIPGNEAMFLVTTHGGLNEDLTGPMAPTEYLKACPYLMQALAAIGAVWGRCRLMRLAPGATVPPHVDTNFYWRRHVRVHVPIDTAPEVTFTVRGNTVHMGAGECWIFDTFSPHQVVNGWTRARTHLVCDTVGGEQLWTLMEAARAGAKPRQVAPGGPVELRFEGRTTGEVMSPWELRYHLDFVVEQAGPHPRIALLAKRLERFAVAWNGVWAEHGPEPSGHADYRGLIAELERDLATLGTADVRLRNGLPAHRQIAEVLHALGLALAPAAAPARLRP